jgi:hypothetical protein
MQNIIKNEEEKESQMNCQKHHQNKKNHRKHCQKTSPVYLFIYLFQITEIIVRNITKQKQEALKSLSKTLPKKKKWKKWKHCQKHHQVS